MSTLTDEQVELWREEQLEALGVCHLDARLLRERLDIVHAVAELVRAGCPVETAIRILQ